MLQSLFSAPCRRLTAIGGHLKILNSNNNANANGNTNTCAIPDHLQRCAFSSSTAATSSSARRVIASQYFSRIAARRQPSPIRALMPLLTIPGMISLGGGMPNSSVFPIHGFSFTMKDGRTVSFTEKETAEVLQYGPTPGLTALQSQLIDFQRKVHRPPQEKFTVSISTGSQDALSRAFEALIDPGDNVLAEEYSYSGSLSYLRDTLNANVHGVKCDEQGMIPESLEDVIRQCPTKGPRRPRVIYVIPTGQNPCGFTYSSQRISAIYSLACKYDLIVLEDDPYYFLAYSSASAPPIGSDSSFRAPALRSFFAQDVEGRVLRFDSFSKIISGGLRMGFVSGPPEFVERMDLAEQASALHPSHLSQMVIFKLLQTLGHEGFIEHLRTVALFYCRRRDAFLAACNKHLSGLATWAVPEAGMFAWIKLNGVNDSKVLIENEARKAKVVLMHGEAFHTAMRTTPYVRAAFSLATDEQMDTALSRFAQLLRDTKK